MDKNGYKIVLIGNCGVGKSSLLYWFLHEKKALTTCPTIGAAFITKRIETTEGQIKFNIWDTAGQERFRSFTKMYYKNTSGCICVFDVTDRSSFDALQYWINDYQQNNNNDNYSLILVANKCDFDKSRWKISRDEIDEYAKKLGFECMYTNCVDGTNTIQTFRRLGELIHNRDTEYENIESGDKKENKIIDLHSNTWEMKWSMCKC
jgi:small GTP-binding protein